MTVSTQHRTKRHRNNPLERLNKEVKRRARACPGEGRGRRHLSPYLDSPVERPKPDHAHVDAPVYPADE
jgi:hypothetical protein